MAEDAMGNRGEEAQSLPPLAVVRPADAAGVARALSLCNEAGIAVVPYGAGTGLMGGARSIQRGIVLDTVRLKTIDPRPDDRLVWADSGCILQDVDAAIAPHGL